MRAAKGGGESEKGRIYIRSAAQSRERRRTCTRTESRTNRTVTCRDVIGGDDLRSPMCDAGRDRVGALPVVAQLRRVESARQIGLLVYSTRLPIASTAPAPDSALSRRMASIIVQIDTASQNTPHSRQLFPLPPSARATFSTQLTPLLSDLDIPPLIHASLLYAHELSLELMDHLSFAGPIPSSYCVHHPGADTSRFSHASPPPPLNPLSESEYRFRCNEAASAEQFWLIL